MEIETFEDSSREGMDPFVGIFRGSERDGPPKISGEEEPIRDSHLDIRDEEKYSHPQTKVYTPRLRFPIGKIERGTEFIATAESLLGFTLRVYKEATAKDFIGDFF